MSLRINQPTGSKGTQNKPVKYNDPIGEFAQGMLNLLGDAWSAAKNAIKDSKWSEKTTKTNIKAKVAVAVYSEKLKPLPWAPKLTLDQKNLLIRSISPEELNVLSKHPQREEILSCFFEMTSLLQLNESSAQAKKFLQALIREPQFAILFKEYIQKTNVVRRQYKESNYASDFDFAKVNKETGRENVGFKLYKMQEAFVTEKREGNKNPSPRDQATIDSFDEVFKLATITIKATNSQIMTDWFDLFLTSPDQLLAGSKTRRALDAGVPLAPFNVQVTFNGTECLEKLQQEGIRGDIAVTMRFQLKHECTKKTSQPIEIPFVLKGVTLDEAKKRLEDFKTCFDIAVCDTPSSVRHQMKRLGQNDDVTKEFLEIAKRSVQQFSASIVALSGPV